MGTFGNLNYNDGGGDTQIDTYIETTKQDEDENTTVQQFANFQNDSFVI